MNPSPFRRILITGGTGFIGHHFVRKLLSLLYPLRLFVRSTSKAHEFFGDQAEYFSGSLENPLEVDQAVQGCDAVIHLGGLYRFGSFYSEALHQTNVRGTQNLIDSCKNHKVQRFLFLGTAGVLKSPHPLITEMDFPSKAPWGTPYKKSKWLAESLVLKSIDAHFPAVIASPTCPIGAGDKTPTPTGRMIYDFLRHDFPFVPQSGINFIDIDDLTEGLLACFLRGKIGQRYLLAGENLWLSEFLKIISDQSGVPFTSWRLPYPILLAGGFLSHPLNRWLGKNSRLNLETALHAGRIQFFDAFQTYQQLDWRPQFSTSDAIQKTLRWIQNESHVKSWTSLSPLCSP